MAAKLVALYNQPADSEAFDAYYRATHTPLVHQMPGLRAFEVSMGGVMTPAGPSPYYLVAELSFDSLEDLQAALGSEEGRAVSDDLGNFATGGVTLLLYETHPSA